MKNLFIYTEKGIKINKRSLHKIVVLLCNELEINVSVLEINFVSSETILGINKKYLNHNYNTDIITFDYSNERNNLDGEIFISIDDALENSKKYHVTLNNEILRLVIHGILHMAGYDDVTLAKRKKMKKVEDVLVQKLQNLSKGLVEKT
ncbi:MAG: rRNA maturation RNase YbeY [Ignavibacteriales bacterium]|nr:MAG: rRNA maturation RNase YbeY [Ignavibacteriales bacterium]